MVEGEVIGNLGIAFEQLGISGQKVKSKVKELGTKLNDTVLVMGDDVLKLKGNGSDVGAVTQAQSTNST
ncbi:hypothetical protein V6N13_043112 [Hibiscus sabdariffa]